MVAMVEHGYAPLYYENIEGGHGGAADIKQRAFTTALAYTFLWKELGPGKPGGRRGRWGPGDAGDAVRLG